MVEIRINNQSLDLTSNVDIYFTFEINNFANLGTRQGSYTNNFTIPITSNNLSILGFPDNLNVQDRIGIDTKLNCEIYLKTLLVDKGFLRILRVNKISRTIQIEFYGSNSDWFEYFKGVKLNTLDLSYFAHQYNATDIIASFNNTEGYIYPWINYGTLLSIEQTEVADYQTVMDVGIRYWLPAVFFKTLIERAFADSPFKLDNQIESDLIYQKAIIPFTNSIFGPFGDIANELTISYSISSVLNLTTTPQKVIFDNPLEPDELGFYDPLTGTYTIGNDGPYFFTVASLANNFNDDQIRFEFYRNGTPTGIIFQGDQLGFQSLFLNDNFVVGETIEVYAYTSTGIFAFSVEDQFGNPRAFRVTPEGLYGTNSTVDLSVNLPDLTVADLLKWLIVSFGLIATYNIFTKTITLKKFSTVKDNKPNSKDWSDKLDLSQEVVFEKEELISNYGKSNIFKYKDDSKDEDLELYNDLNREPYGQGSLDIDNEFLEPIVEIFEAPFAATIEKDCLDTSVRLPRLPGYEYKVLEISGVSVFGSGSRFTFTETTESTGTFPFMFSEASRQYVLVYGTTSYDGIYSFISYGDIAGRNKIELDVPFVADETGFVAFFTRIKIKSEPRVLILDGNYSIEQISNGGIVSDLAIDSNGGGSNNIPFAYFYKSQSNVELMNLDKSLAYSTPNNIRTPILTSLIDDYLIDYQTTIENLEFIKCYLRLNDLDIQTLDQTIPVYIDYFKSYFYVNKIDGYNPNDSSTLVELIAI